jgi:hypothetical protein
MTDTKKYFCDVCDYSTDLNNSFKKHQKTLKHINNSRESSVKMEITKFARKKHQKVHIEINGDEKENEINESIKLIDNITNELTQLREENLLLKINMQNQFSNVETQYKYDDTEFQTVFDNDFTKLFT